MPTDCYDDEDLMLTPCDQYIAEEHYQDCITEEKNYPTVTLDSNQHELIDIWITMQLAELDKDIDIVTFC